MELDQLWTPVGKEPHTLSIIGSTALFLQCNYARRTKDSDILEVENLNSISTILANLAGKNSKWAIEHKMYIDIVKQGIPFLAPKPIFHEMKEWNKNLKNFKIQILDVADVIVSKLKPFRSQDIDDIREMVLGNFVDHTKLIERFKLAVDSWLMDARASDLSRCIKNLNQIEKDFFFKKPTQIQLPDWIDG